MKSVITKILLISLMFISLVSFSNIPTSDTTDTISQDGDKLSTEVPSNPDLNIIPDDENVEPAYKVSVAKAMGLSLAVPGLGNTYVKKGGVYWIMGVAAYGLVAGSVIINKKANDSYDKYLNEMNPVLRQDFYNEADKKDKNSKMLFYAAAGIWVIDLIWTGIQAGKVNRNFKKSSVMVSPIYDPLHQSTGLNLSIRF